MTLPYRILAALALLAGLWAAHAWDLARAVSAAHAAGAAEVQGRWDAERIEAQRAALEAEQAERAKEQARQAEQRRQDEIDARTLADARAAAARSDAVARRMRERAAALEAAAAHCPAGGDPAAAAERETAEAARDLLAQLRGRLDEAATDLARYADASAAAGRSCEARYGSLTSGAGK